jgi:hypothetical protein
MISPLKQKIDITRTDYSITDDDDRFDDGAKIIRIGSWYNVINKLGKIMFPAYMDKICRLPNGLMLIELDNYFNMVDPNRGKRALIFIDWYSEINIEYMISNHILICTRVNKNYDIVKLPTKSGRQTKYSIIEGDVSTDRMQSIIGGIINGTNNQG